MNKNHYYILSVIFLAVGITIAVIGFKINLDENNPFTNSNNDSGGYIAMIVIGFVLIVFSIIFLIVGYRKTENEKMIL